MKPRLHVVTLAVGDLQRALGFYRDGLGWKVAKERAGYAYFGMEGGVWLALCETKLLRDEVGVESAATSVVAQNVVQRSDVDGALADAEKAGATILRRASDRAWGGRSGAFADPDGHVWEITWNPRTSLDAEGRPTGL